MPRNDQARLELIHPTAINVDTVDGSRIGHRIRPAAYHFAGILTAHRKFAAGNSKLFLWVPSEGVRCRPWSARTRSSLPPAGFLRQVLLRTGCVLVSGF